MGDIPLPAGASGEYPREDDAPSPFPGSTIPGQTLQHSPNQPGVYQQASYSSIPPQNYANPQQAFSSQLDMTQSQGSGRGGGPYNMNAMMNALSQQQQYRPPQYPQNQQRFSPQSMSPSTMQNQMPHQHQHQQQQQQQQQQYEAQGVVNPLANQQYYLPQHAGGMPQYYPSSMSPQHSQTNASSRNNMGYYPSQVMINPQGSAPATYYYPQAAPYGTQPAHHLSTQLMSAQAQYLSSTPPQSDPRMAAARPADQYGASYAQTHGPISSDNRQNVVRGPPRKPRQSGHAIWIGNLPPQTDLMSLVHHVCKEAAGLESLFLISKSNCAFANFKDEESCIAAQQKLHDSKFQSIRLVSRLRKNTVEGASGVTAPTGPGEAPVAAPSQPPAAAAAEDATPRTDCASEAKEAASTTVSETGEAKSDAPITPTADGAGSTTTAQTQKDKFFILKSLTMEDLELSVQTGIWATQAHNEEALNKAFATSENVYLVFSANKSGEYFGYAKMLSPINDDPAAAIEFAPKAQAATDFNLPKAIPNEATEFAPKGRIIDDSARGTIFWEAERDEDNSSSGRDTLEVPGQDGEEGSSSGPGSNGDASSVQSESGRTEAKAWGKPFKLEWLSTVRLPFYRARGLRNPWNSNREVKIARDGTELEPSVGRRLIGLFNRVHSPVPPVAGGPGAMRAPVRMAPGYPTMRPPYQQQ